MSTRRKKRLRGGASAPCPRCKGPSHVIITRRDEERPRVNRHRECLKCGTTFETKEVYASAA
jgi:transcriptional regulator NrdR family protein